MLRWLAMSVVRMLNFATNRLTVITGLIAGFAILAMTVLIAMDVTLRYGFNAPTKWVDEISLYLMVVAVFIGLSYTLKEKGHIRVEFIVERLSRRVRNWLTVITSITFLVFTVFLIYLTWGSVLMSFASKLSSRTALDVIIWPFQALIPLGLALMALILIYNIYTEIKVALGKTERSEQEGK